MFGFFPKVNAKNRVAQFSSASVRTVPNAETEEGNKSVAKEKVVWLVLR